MKPKALSLSDATADRSASGNSTGYYANELDEEYMKAAKTGNLLKLRECIESGANIHIKNPGGLNALHLAAREGHPEIAAEVLKHGVDIKAVTKRLNTALHIAALGGNCAVVEVLVKHQAPLDVQALNNITPLYMAAQENHADIVKLLLKHHANSHIAAEGDFEPVDVAVQQGHWEIAVMLLEHGAKRGLRALHIAAKKDDPNAIFLLLENGLVPNIRAPNGYTPLHIAAKHGGVNAANVLVDKGADLNAPAKHNIFPIHVAARHGQTGMVAMLIEAGAHLGMTTKDGLTALHCAARDGHEHCVELLLVHGAPITSKTKHGLTALHMAAQGNHVPSASLIIGHGAHIDDVTLDGVSPLHVAAHYGHLEATQLLLEKGAEIDLRARNGYTALHIASKKSHEAVVQLLLKYKASVHVKNNNGQTALHVAAYFGNVSIVLLLIQAGASLEATTIREETVLHIACRTVQIQIVRLLLRNGANVNAKTKDEETPLHIACRQGSLELVSLLLDSEAEADMLNKEGCSALHLAARDGNVKIVESLLEHNADIALVSERGFTPLHEAAKMGHLHVIIMLLERNANVNAQGKNALTPLHVACHYDRPDVAVLLLDNKANPHASAKNGFTPLHIAARKNQLNIANLLLDRGVEPDHTTKLGVSPLHLAAKEGNVEIVDMLLDHGASPGIQTTNGLTPLHVAVRYNQIEVVKRLLKFMAPIQEQTKTGFSPLHLAVHYGHIEMTALLLKEGADVESRTKNGNTPLHVASYKGCKEIVEKLLEYGAPPNALNKDGYTALSIAEVTEQKGIVETLSKVTNVHSKPLKEKEKGKEFSAKLAWDRLRAAFLAPEDLEETLLIDAADEAEEEAHIKRKIIQEDFEEEFVGLDEALPQKSELSLMPVNEKRLQMDHGEQGQAARSASFSGDVVQEEVIHSELESVVQSSAYEDDAVFNPTGSDAPAAFNHAVVDLKPPKKEGFLVSFMVDARGGCMESRQSGVRIIIPRGACEMPTRISCKSRKADRVSNPPALQDNEAVVSRVLHLSPEGMKFLKPVVIELPHFASLRDSERELVVLRCNTGHSNWKEHASALADDQGADDPQDSPSPAQTMRVITRDFPDRLAVVSRPRKERFLMQAGGGVVKSSLSPKVQINFPADTLNVDTKVLLQVQLADDTLLQPDDETYASAIISLEPPTVLSKPVTVTVPCPWLAQQRTGGGRTSLRLLAWLPKTPRKGTGERAEHEWQDITGVTALSVVSDCATFTTTEFTKYWLVETNSVETLLKRLPSLQHSLSAVPYSARFLVYGRLVSPQKGELCVYLVTDDYLHVSSLVRGQSFVEVARSRSFSVYEGQVVHLSCSGTMLPVKNQSLKLKFEPFLVNRLKVIVNCLGDVRSKTCRMTFIGSMRKDAVGKIPILCSLDVALTDEMLVSTKKTFAPDIVSDETIAMIAPSLVDKWAALADELGMSSGDIQAISDLSAGTKRLPSTCCLEYWRSKSQARATYKLLYNALRRMNEGDLAENVLNVSPRKFSKDAQSHVACASNVVGLAVCPPPRQQDVPASNWLSRANHVPWPVHERVSNGSANIGGSSEPMKEGDMPPKSGLVLEPLVTGETIASESSLLDLNVLGTLPSDDRTLRVSPAVPNEPSAYEVSLQKAVEELEPETLPYVQVDRGSPVLEADTLEVFLPEQRAEADSKQLEALFNETCDEEGAQPLGGSNRVGPTGGEIRLDDILNSYQAPSEDDTLEEAADLEEILRSFSPPVDVDDVPSAAEDEADALSRLMLNGGVALAGEPTLESSPEAAEDLHGRGASSVAEISKVVPVPHKPTAPTTVSNGDFYTASTSTPVSKVPRSMAVTTDLDSVASAKNGNADEPSLHGKELIRHMFGNDDHVLGFFDSYAEGADTVASSDDENGTEL